MFAKPELILLLWLVPAGCFFVLPLCFRLVCCVAPGLTIKMIETVGDESIEAVELPEGVLSDRRDANRHDRRVSSVVKIEGSR